MARRPARLNYRSTIGNAVGIGVINKLQIYTSVLQPLSSVRATSRTAAVSSMGAQPITYDPSHHCMENATINIVIDVENVWTLQHPPFSLRHGCSVPRETLVEGTGEITIAVTREEVRCSRKP